MLRLAWRDARRSPGRSLLVIALIALPVFALSGADVLARTMQLSSVEKSDRTLGHADALITYFGGTIEQLPDASASSGSGARSSPPPTTAQVLGRLPTGSIALTWLTNGIRFSSAYGIRDAGISTLAYTDPLIAPLYHQISGRAPSAPGEIALSRALAKDLGVRLGDPLSTAPPAAGSEPGGLAVPARTYRVVGIVDSRFTNDPDTTFVAPATSAAGIGLADAENTSPSWYVASPRPITWSDVLASNQRGFQVASAYVARHPPARSEVPIYRDNTYGPVGAVRTDTVAAAVMVGGMVLLEIILLAGPAFAVGARRARHTLGLVAAVGGTRRDLRNVVLGGGVILGGLAGLAGVLLGGGLGVALLPLAARVQGQVPGHIDLRPLELGGIVLASTITGLLAAWLPARAAARTDVLAALRGRRGTLRIARRVPVLGAIAAAGGAAIAFGAGPIAHNTNVLLAGSIVAELGLIACVPSLLGLAGRLAGRLPLSGRIALRDASRNRGSTAPAVAAIMAAVTGSVAAGIYVASLDAHSRGQYQPAFTPNTVYSQGVATNGSTDDVLAALTRTLPVRAAAAIREVSTVVDQKTGRYTMIDPTFFPSSTGSGGPGVVSYGGSLLPSILVDDGSAMAAMSGSDSAAVAALRSGRAVVFDPQAIHDGRLTVSIEQYRAGTDDPLSTITRSIPAVLAGSTVHSLTIMLPASVAAQWKLDTDVGGYLATETRAPTDRQKQAAQAALNKLGITGRLYVETGYHSRYQIGLLALLGASMIITLGAAAIATALATVDSRPDLVTLAAIGASPRVRRRLSAARAGVISIIGGVLGVACGFIAPVGYLALHNAVLRSRHDEIDVTSVTVPWYPNIIGTLLLVPLLAMLGAFLLSRSRLPSEG